MPGEPKALSRFSRVVQSIRGGAAINPAAGLPERNLADVLSTFSQGAASKALESSVEDAALEGFNETAETGELQQASDLTLAGQAFNQAARSAHMAGIKRDIKTRLGELAIQANNLPAEQRVDVFVATSDGFREGLLGELGADFKGSALEYFSEEAGGLRLKILGGQQTDLKKQVISDLSLGQQQLLDDIDSSARELNFPLLTKRQREYEALVGDAVAGGFITEDAGAAAIQDMHGVAVQAEILGGFDTVLEGDGLDAAGESLTRFKREDASALGLSAQEKDALETTMTALFNRERSFQAQGQARETAAEKAARARLMQNADNTIKQLNAGFPVDVQDLVDNLINAEEPSKLVDLQEAVRTQGLLAPLLAAPPGAQTQVLTELQDAARAGKLDPENFGLMKALEGVERTTQALLDSDPRTLARQQGQVPEDQDLDFSEAGALAESMAERLESTQAASEHYGFDVPVLYAREVDQFGRFWTSADIDGKLALAAEVSAGLGPDSEQVFAQLDKQEFRTAAFTGQLVNDGERLLAESILRGAEIKAADIMPEETEKATFDLQISDELGNAMAHIPKFRQTVVDSIESVYADRSSLAGDISREHDTERLQQAIQAVVGNVVEDPTGAETVFKDGDQQAFDSWLIGLDASDIAAAGGIMGFDDEAGADLVKRSRFAAMGPGEFWLTTANPLTGLPGFLVTPDGEPFRLVYNSDVAARGVEARAKRTALELAARGE